MFRRTVCKSIAAAVLVGAAWTGISAAWASGTDQTVNPHAPGEIVEYLLGLEHGLAQLGEKEERLVRKLQSFPRDYAAPVSEALRFPQDDLPPGGDALEIRLRLERALGLARLLGAEHARDLVYRFFLQASERVAALRSVDLRVNDPRGEWLQSAHSLRRQALEVLGEFHDNRAIDAVLSTLESDQLATRHVMLQYLGQVGVGSESVRSALTRMTNDPKSSLFRFGPALKTLEVLNQAAETKKDGTG